MADRKTTKSKTTTRAERDAATKLTAKTDANAAIIANDGGDYGVADCFEPNDGDGPTIVRLARTAVAPTSDLALWAAIRKSTEAISFNNYDDFMTRIFFGFANKRGLRSLEEDKIKEIASRRFLPFCNVDPYLLLKVGTEVFLAINGAVDTSETDNDFDNFDADAVSRTLDGQKVTPDTLECLWDNYRVPGGNRSGLLPYLDIIRRRIDTCGRSTLTTTNDEEVTFRDDTVDFDRFLKEKLFRPYMFELIWSYWHEEGMLVQTMNAIARRFQNIRGPGGQRDPLANLEISGLFPLSNLIWGYIQDEQHRLTVLRRAYEYDHQYGITLQGRAIPPLNTADSRSRFVEAFHHLLHLASNFFRQDDDTTVRADGFPLLNALREVHILLSQGAHNQFGDLPSTARQEMLEQQWILSRPEFAQFLPVRLGVAYPEAWMDRVDAMKSLQGWNDTSVTHFNSLAIFGERLLLTIRYGAWSLTNQLPDNAANWARSWRAEIQGYIHAYRSVTGVDLASGRSQQIDSTPPSIHLANRYRLPGARM